MTADALERHRDDEGFLRLALTAEVNGRVGRRRAGKRPAGPGVGG